MPMPVLLAWVCLVATDSASSIQDRIASDKSAGKALVVHVVVALCDNEHQGIVPVPASLGNGQDPKSNLYWGAMFGVRSYLTRRAGWQVVEAPKSARYGILETVVLRASIKSNGHDHHVYLVAEAWDGRLIDQSIARFLRLSAGHDRQRLLVTDEGVKQELGVGGAAHVVIYVGHNGLMDFSADVVQQEDLAPPRSSMVLACMSRQYFADHLRAGGSFPVLLTNGRLAPEAYTLDAVVRDWLAGKSAYEVVEAAASAYDKFQKCGRIAAKRLFAAEQ